MSVTEAFKHPFPYRHQIEFEQINSQTARDFKRLEKDLRAKAGTLREHLSITEVIINRRIKAKDIKEGDRGWISEEFGQEDRNEFWRYVNALVVGTSMQENPREATQTIRWIYANCCLFLMKNTFGEKQTVKEQLRQTAIEGILDATELTEEIEDIMLDRGWINRNLLDSSMLTGPNRTKLLKNLTIFVNNPPLAAEA